MYANQICNPFYVVKMRKSVIIVTIVNELEYT